MALPAFTNPEEAYPGKDLGSQTLTASDKVLADYFGGLEADAAWYRQQSPYGRPVAPSMIVTGVEEGFRGAGFKNTFGTLWMRQEWELRQPLFIGETCSASARVVDIYEHRGRTVVVHETAVRKGDGQVMAVGRHHQSYLLTQSSGRVHLRDPQAKEGVRRFEAPDGEPLEPVARRVTLEMCGLFFHGSANYHTDRRAADRLGFSDVVVGGRMTMGLVGEMLDRRFGRGWYEGGTLSIKFTNIVWPGDAVVARAVTTARAKEVGASRASVAVWVEKEDGTVVIVGEASARE